MRGPISLMKRAGTVVNATSASLIPSLRVVCVQCMCERCLYVACVCVCIPRFFPCVSTYPKAKGG